MDPVTQGALGAAWAQAGTSRGPLAQAAMLGVLGGVLADADVIIRSSADPLLFLEYHRHFSHALVFIPLGGLIAALIAVGFTRGQVSLRAAYGPCTLGYASHGLLDACTSYGTHLLWPFSHARVSWCTVSIVDPIFTLTLIAGVVLSARRKARRPVLIALGVAAAYLGLGVVQSARARAAQEELVARRGHVAQRAAVRPSLGQNILFRCFYEHEGRFYADAIRVGWLSAPKVYEGESIAVLDEAAFWRGRTLTETKRRDLERFRFFSDGFLVRHPRYPSMIGDFRYAAIPNAIDPMWGIDVDTPDPNDHCRFKNVSRDRLVTQRGRFIDMLLGR